MQLQMTSHSLSCDKSCSSQCAANTLHFALEVYVRVKSFFTYFYDSYQHTDLETVINGGNCMKRKKQGLVY